MRLRIFDLKTPWFWFVSFYQRAYGKPWLEIAIYDGRGPRKWWLHCWEWEKIPDHSPFVGSVAVVYQEAE